MRPTCADERFREERIESGFRRKTIPLARSAARYCFLSGAIQFAVWLFSLRAEQHATIHPTPALTYSLVWIAVGLLLRQYVRFGR